MTIGFLLFLQLKKTKPENFIKADGNGPTATKTLTTDYKKGKLQRRCGYRHVKARMGADFGGQLLLNVIWIAADVLPAKRLMAAEPDGRPLVSDVLPAKPPFLIQCKNSSTKSPICDALR